MNRARAKRLEWAWEWYVRRALKLNAVPICPSWERHYKKLVTFDYTGRYREPR